MTAHRHCSGGAVRRASGPVWPGALVLLLVGALLAGGGPAAAQTPPPAPGGRVLVAPAPFRKPLPDEPLEVGFMRRFMDRINPQLRVEDARCFEGLPTAILREARAQGLDWQTFFTIAWQESAFDCHAKNRRDRGTAYGPFQIRPLWHAAIGNPRPDYFDPDVAAARVARVLVYLRDSRGHAELVRRRFVYPLLCLYHAGERQPVNMDYCRRIGQKRRRIEADWQAYRRLQQTGPRKE